MNIWQDSNNAIIKEIDNSIEQNKSINFGIGHLEIKGNFNEDQTNKCIIGIDPYEENNKRCGQPYSEQ